MPVSIIGLPVINAGYNSDAAAHAVFSNPPLLVDHKASCACAALPSHSTGLVAHVSAC